MSHAFQEEALLLEPLIIGLSLVKYGAAWWSFRWIVGGAKRWIDISLRTEAVSENRAVMPSRLQHAGILCLIFLEIPVVYGLVYSMISARIPHLFEWLAIASVIGMVLLRWRGFPIVFELMERLQRLNPLAS